MKKIERILSQIKLSKAQLRVIFFLLSDQDSIVRINNRKKKNEILNQRRDQVFEFNEPTLNALVRRDVLIRHHLKGPSEIFVLNPDLVVKIFK